MGLNKYKLGELLVLCDERNSIGGYSLNDVRGISIRKEFIETKADMAGVSLTPYILVYPDSFAYVPVTSRNGEKITIAHNTSDNTYIVSSSYIVFKVGRPDILLSNYLFMYFNRPEFDRYARFSSWGSARETFSWDDFCDIEITLPDIEQQRKYVNVYLALQKNLETYQSKVNNLKIVCNGYIEKLRRDYVKKYPVKMVRIGDFIAERTEINNDGQIVLEQGINIQKEFITPQRSNSNLLGRKIVRTGDITYCTQLNNSNVAIAYREGVDCIVSSVYDVFFVKYPSILLPKYLMLWLIRPEFGRYVYNRSTGSAYEFLSFDDLSDYRIPLPAPSIQASVVNIYDCINERNSIANNLKTKIKNLCPILIKGSLLTDN